MAYMSGDRYQMTLISQSLDEMIPEDDKVRLYDTIIDKIFNEIKDRFNYNPYKPGAYEYDPRIMLKLLVYGCSYGIRSSRKLEKALWHNLSFMWITGGMKPDHWTINDFRAKNAELIKEALRECARMCLGMGFIEGIR